MVDITPAVPQGRQLINGYGNWGFRIAGESHKGSVIVLPDRTIHWPVTAWQDVGPESFASVVEAAESVEVLLIGCGARMAMPSPAMRGALRAHGIVPETMDTGAACRTFNVLLSEERAVAAALIAVE
ncbi:MAG: Mth938-like domain-containing protein [Rhodospirillaceae bacterium]